MFRNTAADIQMLSKLIAVELRHGHFSADVEALIGQIIFNRSRHRKRSRWNCLSLKFILGALPGVSLYFLIALAQWFVTGAALGQTIGSNTTTMLIPASAILGIFILWWRAQ